jgi:hypothetical protein
MAIFIGLTRIDGANQQIFLARTGFLATARAGGSGTNSSKMRDGVALENVD